MLKKHWSKKFWSEPKVSCSKDAQRNSESDDVMLLPEISPPDIKSNWSETSCPVGQACDPAEPGNFQSKTLSDRE